jgi:hypothetical protein
MRVVAVRTPHVSDDSLSGAALVVDSLTDLTPAQLAALLR